MIKFIQLLFVLLLISLGCSNKDTKTQSIQNKLTPRSEKEYFDSVMYSILRESENYKDNIIDSLFKKNRKELFNTIPIKLKADTLYIIDTSADDCLGRYIKSIFWTTTDTCMVQCERWCKLNKFDLTKEDICRMKLVSAWDVHSMQKLEIATDSNKNKFRRQPAIYFNVSRVIFIDSTVTVDYGLYSEWYTGSDTFKNIFGNI